MPCCERLAFDLVGLDLTRVCFLCPLDCAKAIASRSWPGCWCTSALKDVADWVRCCVHVRHLIVIAPSSSEALLLSVVQLIVSLPWAVDAHEVVMARVHWKSPLIALTLNDFSWHCSWKVAPTSGVELFGCAHWFQKLILGFLVLLPVRLQSGHFVALHIFFIRGWRKSERSALSWHLELDSHFVVTLAPAALAW
eukprot:5629349-Amphidinium_carterae.2